MDLIILVERQKNTKINIYPVPSNQKIGKPNNLIVFGSSTANGLKQDSKNRLWSLMPEVMNLISF
jgi:hypothetical protein